MHESITVRAIRDDHRLVTIACDKTRPGAADKTPPSPAASRSATATPDEFASARANFTKHCKECHGETAYGGTVTVEGKKLKVPSLRTGHALSHHDSELVKQITKGGDGMPAFNERLSAKEIDDMLRFIRRELQGGQAPQANSNMKMDLTVRFGFEFQSQPTREG